MCFAIMGGLLVIFIVVWILHKIRGKLVGGKVKLAGKDEGGREGMEMQRGLENGDHITDEK
jgi:hypothetical protein